MLTQAREREGYGSHNWDVQGVPVATEAGRNFQQPEVCLTLSWRSWPQIMGPSAVACCTISQEDVGSDDLPLLTGPLVTAEAVIVVTLDSGV